MNFAAIHARRLDILEPVRRQRDGAASFELLSVSDPANLF